MTQKQRLTLRNESQGASFLPFFRIPSLDRSNSKPSCGATHCTQVVFLFLALIREIVKKLQSCPRTETLHPTAMLGVLTRELSQSLSAEGDQQGQRLIDSSLSSWDLPKGLFLNDRSRDTTARQISFYCGELKLGTIPTPQMDQGWMEHCGRSCLKSVLPPIGSDL